MDMLGYAFQFHLRRRLERRWNKQFLVDLQLLGEEARKRLRSRLVVLGSIDGEEVVQIILILPEVDGVLGCDARAAVAQSSQVLCLSSMA